MEPQENEHIEETPQENNISQEEIEKKQKPKKSLFKRIKRIVIICGIVFIGLFITGVILAYVFEKDIKKYAIEEINRQLTAEVQLNEKDVSFSFFKKFPKASLNFSNLLILEENKQDTLLFADNISLEFGLFSVLGGNYTVNEIDIEQANINLKTYENGKANYVIWEESTDTIKTNEAFSFDLQELNLTNVALNYDDEKSKFSSSLLMESTSLSGKFTDKKTKLSLASQQHITYIGQDTIMYFGDKASTLILAFDLDNETNILTINEGDISIEEMELDVKGHYNIDGETYKLHTVTSNLTISDVFTLFPIEIAEKLSNYNTDGVVTSEADIVQEKGETTPNVTATFSVANGTLTEGNTGAKIEGLAIEGTYNLTPMTQQIELSSLSGNLQGGSFAGNAKVIGKSNMTILSSFSADLDLKTLAEFLNFEQIENLSGKIVLDNTFRGTSNQNGLSVNEFSGKTDFNNVSLKLIGRKYSLANLTGDFNFNRFTSTGTFKGDYGSSDFSISTQVKNMMEYMISDKQLLVNMYLQSNQVNIDELTQLVTEDVSTNSEEIIDTVVQLPKKVVTNLSASVGTIQYGKHELKQFKGNLVIASKSIASNNISFIANKGIYALSGRVIKRADESFGLTADAVCGHIDINDFFTRFDNFGQEILQAKHLKGEADAIINIKGDLTSAMTLNTKSLLVTTDFTISKGELINFEMFDEMAAYIRGNKIAKSIVKVDMLSEKLKHVRFDEMTNQLIVKNERIILPDMIIKSSAMDIGVYGGQTFAGAINYGVNFRLRDVLTKDKTSEFGYIKDDGTGTRMFISVEGTTDEPVFRLDQAAKRRYAQKKKVEERNNLKSILKKEFGFFKKDTAVKTNPTNTNQNNNTPQFQVEWEEDEGETSSNSNNQSSNSNTSTNTQTVKEEKKKKKNWLQKLAGDKKEKEKVGFEVEEDL